jgi:putative DNA primase/helicase
MVNSQKLLTYRDAQSTVVFEKLRYPGKRFLQRKPNGKTGYDYKLGDITKPLYRLPELLVANQIMICEGDKDCNNVMHAFGEKAGSQHVSATTNFDGAGKWNAQDSMFFAGKRVVIFPDQDEIGKKHRQERGSGLCESHAIARRDCVL